MPKITYVENDGKSHTVEVDNGLTVMEGAVQNNIPGIDADCGGGMACATCHVYVKEEWFDKINKKTEGEDDMLDQAYEPNKFSRLSCQISVRNEIDGLVVDLPKNNDQNRCINNWSRSHRIVHRSSIEINWSFL